MTASPKLTALPKPVKRDPERTRARILKAAVAEFSTRGISGARTARIAKKARVNVRMLYHYFGGKDDLYVAVLESAYERLRAQELQLDLNSIEPLQGLLRLFEFIDAHLAGHAELRALFAFENLNQARHLRRSARIPTMSSPVIGLIDDLLARGVASGQFRTGIDPLRLYVSLVSLSYYSKSHAHTLSRIFSTDLADPAWQAAQGEDIRRMLTLFVVRDPVTLALP